MELFVSRVLLSLLVGAFVVLGLPLARLRSPSQSLREFLYALSTGILLFLLLDLIGHARELPWEVATAQAGSGSNGPALLLVILFVGGLAAGVVALTYLHRRWSRPAPSGYHSGDRVLGIQALPLSILIAVSIGLYNFAQGLAIGQAGRFTVPTAIGSGEGELLLIIGFALHNAAKGVAIAGPLVGRHPSWRDLSLLGLVAGAPTVAGTLVGIFVWSPYGFVAVLTFAAGAILVVMYLALSREYRVGSRARVASGLLAGFLVGVITTLALEINQYSLPELMSSYWL